MRKLNSPHHSNVFNRSARSALPGCLRLRYAGTVPGLLDEIYRLQNELSGIDSDEQRLLKMCANLLESHHQVKEPRNRLTFEEYGKMPGRWELPTPCWAITDVEGASI